MFATRLLAITFLPSFVGAFVVIFIKKQKIIIESLLPIVLFVISFSVLTFTMNYPSIYENGSLSFHEKKLGSTTVDWPHLQYLTALELEKGNVENGQHVSIQETERFIEKNGKESLPSTILESILFNPMFTLKQFFIDFLLISRPLVRLTGVFFLLNFLLVLISVIKQKKIDIYDEVFVYGILHFMVLSFIIIGYVETRWLIGTFCLCVISFSKRIFNYSKMHSNKKMLDFYIINTQLLLLTLMNVPYLFSYFKITF